MYSILKYVHDTPRQAACEELQISTMHRSRSPWPCGLTRTSAAARLLRLWVRIPPGADVCLLWVSCVVR